MTILFEKIPKTCTELLFVIGTLGLLLFLKKDNRFLAYSFLSTLIFMITWRFFLQITSSRYAAALIYPYTLFSGYFIASTLKSHILFSRFLSCAAIVIIVVLFSKKEFLKPFCDSNQEILADIHKRYNAKSNCLLIMQRDDAARVKHFENSNIPIEEYPDPPKKTDLSFFVSNYTLVNRTILYAVTFPSDINPDIVSPPNATSSHYKRVLSLFTNSKNTKRLCLYFIKSRALFKPYHQTDITDTSSILINGSFEQVDSPEDSYNKLKRHIGDYASYYDYDPAILTPQNAYFINDIGFTQFMPKYNCSSDSPISGKYSVSIESKNNPSALIFYQRFTNGLYHFSCLVKGKKGTVVSFFTDSYKDNNWRPKNIASISIPDNRVYQISSSFPVTSLSSGEFFLIGASVRDGQAYLDDFFLDMLSTADFHHD